MTLSIYLNLCNFVVVVVERQTEQALTAVPEKLQRVTGVTGRKSRQSRAADHPSGYTVGMINIKTNAPDIKRILDKVRADQLPYARSLIANRLAQKVKANETLVMKSRLDRPKPFTLNSLRLKAGNKQKPDARVWFKDFGYGTIDWHYLNPNVAGGGRTLKAFEKMFARRGLLKPGQYLVPASSARRDAFGNMHSGQLAQILSAMQLHSLSGYNANASGSKRSQRVQRRSGADRYFWATINGETGVWQRERTAWGEAARAILLVEQDSPKYKIRFPFFDVATNTVAAHYERIGTDAIEEVLRTQRP